MKEEDKKLSFQEWTDKYFPSHKYLFEQDEDNRFVISKPIPTKEQNDYCADGCSLMHDLVQIGKPDNNKFNCKACNKCFTITRCEE